MRMRWLSHCSALARLSLLLLAPTVSGTAPSQPRDTFNWSDIEPQSRLRYQSCYNGLECARLLVPLDWSRPGQQESWQQVALAVIRLPATVKQSDPSFGGSIVLNPGGPSGSGVDFLRRNGKGIQEIVAGEKHFEILSFDPRGTKYSTPSTACFALDQDRDEWKAHNNDAGGTADGPFSLNVRWALAHGFGQICNQTDLGVFPDGSNIRQYVSSAQVAHDMVHLTDVIDEELRSAVAVASSPYPSAPAAHDQTVLSNSRAVPPLLNYWGFSYGTLLGNTFASLFPHRIGRLLLDGVVDADDYSASGWSTNLQDNDLVWDHFFQWCFEAGSACALYSGELASASDLRAQFTQFTDFLQDNPLSLVYDGKLHLITYSILQDSMHSGSYAPYQRWPNLAIHLQKLMSADYEGVALDLASSSSFLPFAPPYLSPLGRRDHDIDNDDYHRSNILDPFNNSTNTSMPGYAHGIEATTAILCGDGQDITSDTKSDFVNYVGQLKNQSALVGPHWSQITLLCRHWPRTQRPADRNRFTGPFVSQLRDYQLDGGRSSPILFIGNTADPVTPLRNAVRMSSAHEGSAVLVQNAPGHCSGVNIPSRCTWTVISDFFNHGTLPANGTRCEVDFKPWDYPPAARPGATRD